MTERNDQNDPREQVRKAYGQIARQQSSCRGEAGGGTPCRGDAKAYTVGDHPVPESELGLSCGNPLAFGYINPGDIVVDLGSGAGKDVFLAAQKVGQAGRAIGVDMTDEMLALARRHAVSFFTTTGLVNVEFRKGHIEDLPVEDASVDVVISNCVINLSPDKPRVFREVHRVLRPGGRMIVSDIVLNRPLPQAARDDADLYVACIAGAMRRDEYLQAVRDAGFARVKVVSEQLYLTDGACCDPTVRQGSAGQDGLDGVASSITVLAMR